MKSRPVIAINCDYDPGTTGYKVRHRIAVYRPYIDAVVESGGLPLLVPPSRPEVLKEYLRLVDGIVFTGGLDYPPGLYGERPHPEVVTQSKERAESDRQLMRLVLASPKPALGICAGLQLLNISGGGALIQHLRTAATHKAIHPGKDSAHTVAVYPGTRLRKIFQSATIQVNSAHHQAADPRRLGRGISVSAQAPDGTIEGLELKDDKRRFFVFVQWHPERMPDAAHRRKIFGALVASCRRVRRRR